MVRKLPRKCTVKYTPCLKVILKELNLCIPSFIMIYSLIQNIFLNLKIIWARKKGSLPWNAIMGNHGRFRGSDKVAIKKWVQFDIFIWTNKAILGSLNMVHFKSLKWINITKSKFYEYSALKNNPISLFQIDVTWFFFFFYLNSSNITSWFQKIYCFVFGQIQLHRQILM